MALRGLLRDPLSLSGCHCLPLTGSNHDLHPFLEQRGVRDKQISILGELGDSVARTSVASEHNHGVRCFKSVGIGFVFAGCWGLLIVMLIIVGGGEMVVSLMVYRA